MTFQSATRSLATPLLVFPSLLLVMLASCASSTAAGAASVVTPEATSGATLSHDVFFTFANPEGADVDGLIEACEKLRGIPGVLHLTAGPRDTAQARDVNETTFHVALHVEFLNQAAYDGYGPHPTHQALVEEFLPEMGAVVVYDALIRR